jgi:TM2 domain-containing membrane protein YozV
MFPPLQKRYAIGKSPTSAVILSLLIVGLGQFYNGDKKKALLMLVTAVVGVFLTMGIATIVVWIWSPIDSYLVASGKVPLWY